MRVTKKFENEKNDNRIDHSNLPILSPDQVVDNEIIASNIDKVSKATSEFSESYDDFEIEYLDGYDGKSKSSVDVEEEVECIQEYLPMNELVTKIESFPKYSKYSTRGMQCCICSQLFEEHQSLETHYQEAHGMNEESLERSHLQCDYCNHIFADVAKLQKHKPTMKDLIYYVCSLCDSVLKDETSYIDHILSEVNHTEAIESFTSNEKFKICLSESNELCSYQCCQVDCFYETTIKCDVLKHISRTEEHGASSKQDKQTNRRTENSFVCCLSRCFDDFCSFEELQSHARDVHDLLRIKHTQSRQSNAFVCSICLKGFETKHAYERHRKINKTHQFICLECGAQYASKVNLRQHERSKCGTVATIQCEKCDKTFTTISGLRNHSIQHETSRPYTCDICGRSFRRKGVLKDHMNTVHATEKLFKCTICMESFSSRTIFKSHMNSHTHEKLYQCRHCEKRYLKASDRNMHEKQVHLGIRPFQCNYCPVSFIRDRERRLHERIHTKEKLYTCEVCAEGYDKFAEFKQHRLNEHGLETMRDSGSSMITALMNKNKNHAVDD
ncbi:oocyte zinc finger protein XlCOF6-like isoform X2 [Uranotaenia lowii]|nr:oocyte zinc finger protein XlCOF6-like isoform X2 [Uranotaenia lowii]